MGLRTWRVNRFKGKYFSFFLGLSLCLFFSVVSLAQDFTATTIEDYGDICVMEATGNFDDRLPDGSTNSNPKQEITREFFAVHPDNCDFLVLFTNFDFQMPQYAIAGEQVTAAGLYYGVKNDVQGIGESIFDNTSLYGSEGKLQGIINMGCLAHIVSDPLNPGFESTMSVLSHEILHRWGAYVT